MTHWPQVRAGDVFELVRRPVTLDAPARYTEIGVRSFGKGIFHKPPVTGVELGNKRVFEIGADELVINIVFAWEGAVAVSGPDELGKIGSHRFLTYRADPDRADPEFVRAYLVSEPGRSAVLAASPGSAGRNRTLSQAGFERLMIPLPPLDEQRRIAAHLSAIGSSGQVLTESWVKGRRTANGLVEALLGRADSTGPATALSEVFAMRREPVSVRPGDRYRTAGVYSYARGLFWRQPQSGSDIKYPTLYRVEPGQMVMSKLFAWEGAIALSTEEFEGALVSPEFPTFDVDRDRADPLFLRAVVSRPDFYRSLAVSGMGNRRQRVNPAMFLSARVHLPPLDVQRAIGQADSKRREIDARLQEQVAVASVLGPATLNEVFSGRL